MGDFMDSDVHGGMTVVSAFLMTQCKGRRCGPEQLANLLGCTVDAAIEYLSLTRMLRLDHFFILTEYLGINLGELGDMAWRALMFGTSGKG